MPFMQQIIVLCDAGADCGGGTTQGGPASQVFSVPVEMPTAALCPAVRTRFPAWRFHTPQPPTGVPVDISMVMARALCPACVACGKDFDDVVFWQQVKGPGFEPAEGVRQLLMPLSAEQVDAVRTSSTAWVSGLRVRVEDAEGARRVIEPTSPRSP